MIMVDSKSSEQNNNKPKMFNIKEPWKKSRDIRTNKFKPIGC